MANQNNETLLIQRAHGNAIRLVSIPKSFTALQAIGGRGRARKTKTWV